MAMSSPEKHRRGRAALLEAWPRVTGEQPSLAELQIAGAQGHLESGYGEASYTNLATGEKSGVIHNWGAVQCGKPPCDPSKCFEATDTHADGSKYQWCYRKYATSADGAAHMIEHMTKKRPTSWAHMKRGDVDAWAQAMRTRDPITGTGLYFEQSAENRAKGIELRIKEIAEALGEPIAATRGGAPAGPPAPAPAPSPGGSSPEAPSTGASVAEMGFVTALLYGIWRFWKGKRK